MSVYNKDNKFLSYLLVLVSLFILILFTKDQYSQLQVNLDEKETGTYDLQEKTEKLTTLNEIKNTLKNDESTTQRYLVPFSEDKLITYLYQYGENIEENTGNMSIKNITFSEPIKNEYGFQEVNINVNATVSSEAIMKEFLDFLIAEESEYRFFIDNFFFPNDKREGSFNISVPLKLFYTNTIDGK